MSSSSGSSFFDDILEILDYYRSPQCDDESDLKQFHRLTYFVSLIYSENDFVRCKSSEGIWLLETLAVTYCNITFKLIGLMNDPVWQRACIKSSILVIRYLLSRLTATELLTETKMALLYQVSLFGFLKAPSSSDDDVQIKSSWIQSIRNIEKRFHRKIDSPMDDKFLGGCELFSQWAHITPYIEFVQFQRDGPEESYSLFHYQCMDILSFQTRQELKRLGGISYVVSILLSDELVKQLLKDYHNLVNAHLSAQIDHTHLEPNGCSLPELNANLLRQFARFENVSLKSKEELSNSFALVHLCMELISSLLAYPIASAQLMRVVEAAVLTIIFKLNTNEHLLQDEEEDINDNDRFLVDLKKFDEIKLMIDAFTKLLRHGVGISYSNYDYSVKSEDITAESIDKMFPIERADMLLQLVSRLGIDKMSDTNLFVSNCHILLANCIYTSACKMRYVLSSKENSILDSLERQTPSTIADLIPLEQINCHHIKTFIAFMWQAFVQFSEKMFEFLPPEKVQEADLATSEREWKSMDSDTELEDSLMLSTLFELKDEQSQKESTQFSWMLDCIANQLSTIEDIVYGKHQILIEVFARYFTANAEALIDAAILLASCYLRIEKCVTFKLDQYIGWPLFKQLTDIIVTLYKDRILSKNIKKLLLKSMISKMDKRFKSVHMSVYTCVCECMLHYLESSETSDMQVESVREDLPLIKALITQNDCIETPIYCFENNVKPILVLKYYRLAGKEYLLKELPRVCDHTIHAVNSLVGYHDADLRKFCENPSIKELDTLTILLYLLVESDVFNVDKVIRKFLSDETMAIYEYPMFCVLCTSNHSFNRSSYSKWISLHPTFFDDNVVKISQALSNVINIDQLNELFICLVKLLVLLFDVHKSNSKEINRILSKKISWQCVTSLAILVQILATSSDHHGSSALKQLHLIDDMSPIVKCLILKLNSLVESHPEGDQIDSVSNTDTIRRQLIEQTKSRLTACVYETNRLMEKPTADMETNVLNGVEMANMILDIINNHLNVTPCETTHQYNLPEIIKPIIKLTNVLLEIHSSYNLKMQVADDPFEHRYQLLLINKFVCTEAALCRLSDCSSFIELSEAFQLEKFTIPQDDEFNELFDIRQSVTNTHFWLSILEHIICDNNVKRIDSKCLPVLEKSFRLIHRILSSNKDSLNPIINDQIVLDLVYYVSCPFIPDPLKAILQQLVDHNLCDNQRIADLCKSQPIKFFVNLLLRLPEQSSAVSLDRNESVAAVITHTAVSKAIRKLSAVTIIDHILGDLLSNQLLESSTGEASLSRCDLLVTIADMFCRIEEISSGSISSGTIQTLTCFLVRSFVELACGLKTRNWLGSVLLCDDCTTAITIMHSIAIIGKIIDKDNKNDIQQALTNAKLEQQSTQINEFTSFTALSIQCVCSFAQNLNELMDIQRFLLNSFGFLFCAIEDNHRENSFKTITQCTQQLIRKVSPVDFCSSNGELLIRICTAIIKFFTSSYPNDAIVKTNHISTVQLGSGDEKSRMWKLMPNVIDKEHTFDLFSKDQIKDPLESFISNLDSIDFKSKIPTPFIDAQLSAFLPLNDQIVENICEQMLSGCPTVAPPKPFNSCIKNDQTSINVQYVESFSDAYDENAKFCVGMANIRDGDGRPCRNVHVLLESKYSSDKATSYLRLYLLNDALQAKETHLSSKLKCNVKIDGQLSEFSTCPIEQSIFAAVSGSKLTIFHVNEKLAIDQESRTFEADIEKFVWISQLYKYAVLCGESIHIMDLTVPMNHTQYHQLFKCSFHCLNLTSCTIVDETLKLSSIEERSDTVSTNNMKGDTVMLLVEKDNPNLFYQNISAISNERSSIKCPYFIVESCRLLPENEDSQSEVTSLLYHHKMKVLFVGFEAGVISTYSLHFRDTSMSLSQIGMIKPTFATQPTVNNLLVFNYDHETIFPTANDMQEVGGHPQVIKCKLRSCYSSSAHKKIIYLTMIFENDSSLHLYAFDRQFELDPEFVKHSSNFHSILPDGGILKEPANINGIGFIVPVAGSYEMYIPTQAFSNLSPASCYLYNLCSVELSANSNFQPDQNAINYDPYSVATEVSRMDIVEDITVTSNDLEELYTQEEIRRPLDQIQQFSHARRFSITLHNNDKVRSVLAIQMLKFPYDHVSPPSVQIGQVTYDFPKHVAQLTVKLPTSHQAPPGHSITITFNASDHPVKITMIKKIRVFGIVKTESTKEMLLQVLDERHRSSHDVDTQNEIHKIRIPCRNDFDSCVASVIHAMRAILMSKQTPDSIAHTIEQYKPHLRSFTHLIPCPAVIFAIAQIHKQFPDYRIINCILNALGLTVDLTQNPLSIIAIESMIMIECYCGGQLFSTLSKSLDEASFQNLIERWELYVERLGSRVIDERIGGDDPCLLSSEIRASLMFLRHLTFHYDSTIQSSKFSFSWQYIHRLLFHKNVNFGLSSARCFFAIHQPVLEELSKFAWMFSLERISSPTNENNPSSAASLKYLEKMLLITGDHCSKVQHLFSTMLPTIQFQNKVSISDEEKQPVQTEALHQDEAANPICNTQYTRKSTHLEYLEILSELLRFVEEKLTSGSGEDLLFTKRLYSIHMFLVLLKRPLNMLIASSSMEQLNSQVIYLDIGILFESVRSILEYALTVVIENLSSDNDSTISECSLLVTLIIMLLEFVDPPAINYNELIRILYDKFIRNNKRDGSFIDLAFKLFHTICRLDNIAHTISKFQSRLFLTPGLLDPIYKIGCDLYSSDYNDNFNECIIVTMCKCLLRMCCQLFNYEHQLDGVLKVEQTAGSKFPLEMIKTFIKLNSIVGLDDFAKTLFAHMYNSEKCAEILLAFPDWTENVNKIIDLLPPESLPLVDLLEEEVNQLTYPYILKANNNDIINSISNALAKISSIDRGVLSITLSINKAFVTYLIVLIIFLPENQKAKILQILLKATETATLEKEEETSSGKANNNQENAMDIIDLIIKTLTLNRHFFRKFIVSCMIAPFDYEICAQAQKLLSHIITYSSRSERVYQDLNALLLDTDGWCKAQGFQFNKLVIDLIGWSICKSEESSNVEMIRLLFTNTLEYIKVLDALLKNDAININRILLKRKECVPDSLCYRWRNYHSEYKYLPLDHLKFDDSSYRYHRNSIIYYLNRSYDVKSFKLNCYLYNKTFCPIKGLKMKFSNEDIPIKYALHERIQWSEAFDVPFDTKKKIDFPSPIFIRLLMIEFEEIVPKLGIRICSSCKQVEQNPTISECSNCSTDLKTCRSCREILDNGSSEIFCEHCGQFLCGTNEIKLECRPSISLNSVHNHQNIIKAEYEMDLIRKNIDFYELAVCNEEVHSVLDFASETTNQVWNAQKLCLYNDQVNTMNLVSSGDDELTPPYFLPTTKHSLPIRNCFYCEQEGLRNAMRILNACILFNVCVDKDPLEQIIQLVESIVQTHFNNRSIRNIGMDIAINIMKTCDDPNIVNRCFAILTTTTTADSSSVGLSSTSLLSSDQKVEDEDCVFLTKDDVTNLAPQRYVQYLTSLNIALNDKRLNVPRNMEIIYARTKSLRLFTSKLFKRAEAIFQSDLTKCSDLIRRVNLEIEQYLIHENNFLCEISKLLLLHESLIVRVYAWQLVGELLNTFVSFGLDIVKTHLSYLLLATTDCEYCTFFVPYAEQYLKVVWNAIADNEESNALISRISAIIKDTTPRIYGQACKQACTCLHTCVIYTMNVYKILIKNHIKSFTLGECQLSDQSSLADKSNKERLDHSSIVNCLYMLSSGSFSYQVSSNLVCRHACELLDIVAGHSEFSYLLLEAGVSFLSAEYKNLSVVNIDRVIRLLNRSLRHLVPKYSEFSIKFVYQSERERLHYESNIDYKSSDPLCGPLMSDIQNLFCLERRLFALVGQEHSVQLQVRNKVIAPDVRVSDVYEQIWCPGITRSDDTSAQEWNEMSITFSLAGLEGVSQIYDIESLQDKSLENSRLIRNISLLHGSIPLFCHILEHCASSIHLRNVKIAHNALSVIRICTKISESSRQELFDFLSSTDNNLNIFISVLIKLCQNDYRIMTAHNKIAISDVLDILITIFNWLIDDINDEQKYTQIMNKLITQGQFNDFMNITSLLFVNNDKTILSTQMESLFPLMLVDKRFHCSVFDCVPIIVSADILSSEIKNNATNTSKYLKRLKRMLLALPTSPRVNGFRQFLQQRELPSTIVSSLQTAVSTTQQALEQIDKLLADLIVILKELLIGNNDEEYLASITAPLVPCLRQLLQTPSCHSTFVNAKELLKHLNVKEDVSPIEENSYEHTKKVNLKMRRAARQKAVAEKFLKTSKSMKYLKEIQETVFDNYDDFHLCSICKDGYRQAPDNCLSFLVYIQPRMNILLSPTTVDSSSSTSLILSNCIPIHKSCHRELSRSRNDFNWNDMTASNAGAQCNALLPIWSGSDDTSDESKSTRKITYMKDQFKSFSNSLNEICGLVEIGSERPFYLTMAHSVKNILLRISCMQSLSSYTGGGGLDSNISILPYQLLLIVYNILELEIGSQLNSYLKTFETKNIRYFTTLQSIGQSEGPHYWTLMHLFVLNSTKEWFKSDKNVGDGFTCGRSICARQLLAISIAQNCRNRMFEGFIDDNVSDTVEKLFLERSEELSVIFKPALLYFTCIDHLMEFLSEIEREIMDQSSSNKMPGEFLLSVWQYVRTKQRRLQDSCNSLIGKLERFYEVQDVNQIVNELKIYRSTTETETIESIINDIFQ